MITDIKENNIYSRDNIIDILELNREDKAHLSTYINRTLNKFKIEYEYNKILKQYTITSVPSIYESEMRLYILNLFKKGIKTDINAFSAFIFLLLDAEDNEFKIAPYHKRAEIIKNDFNIPVSSNTIRTYIKHLMELNLLDISIDKENIWKTTITHNNKYYKMKQQTLVDINNKDEMDCYYNFIEYRKDLLNQDVDFGDACVKAANHCGAYYYKTKTLNLNAFTMQTINTLYNLSCNVLWNKNNINI